MKPSPATVYVIALATGCASHATNSTPDAGGTAATQQMVFMAQSVVDGATTSEVAIMNLDGSARIQLTNDGKFKFLPHFSPDAKKVVYTKFAVGGYGSPNPVMDIAVYDLGTGAETMITSGGNNSQGTWSPDGKRVAFGSGGGASGPSTISTVDLDGTHVTKVASASGAADDELFGDIAWSNDDWILFVVVQVDTANNNCFKVRTDKIRPDGTSRTKLSDGGPSCTPMGFEQSGDADPGWSADGKTIYSSRGFPRSPANGPPGTTERRLYAFSSDAWYAGKPEIDLSLPSEPSCIEGVPKGSPDGKRVLLFRKCFAAGGVSKGGIHVTDTTGSYRTFVGDGFGPDWNPVAAQ